VVGDGLGTGELPDASDAEWVDLALPPAADVLDGVRAFTAM